MGGKTGTTTSSVAIPPEVLARYSAVNTQAQATATQPFQQYGTDASAFVAPLNQEQNAATAQTNQYANAAQPAINYAEQGYTPEGFQQGVQGYMNPFLQNAMGSTAAQINNVNQQQQQQLLGTAIQQGAFGGDRGKVAQAALMNQQNLAEGQTLGNMASQGFQSAAQNYQTGLGQIGALGVQGQQAGLQGAQAMMGAGTLGQQTTQAGQSALYNQFQQQQAYPFQVAQFLANIAEGTGALSGSTTTTTGPQSWFSDARLKEDIKQVGTAKNGLPIYTFKYKGDDAEQTHIGYMAQDVEKIHPEAVGESHGYKTVDYDKASEPVHRAFGGLNLNPASTLMGEMGQGSQDPSVLPPVNGGVVPNENHGGHDNVEHGSFGFSDMGGQQASDRSNGAWARGGATNSEGGVVAPQHAAEGYFNGGDVVSPYDLSAILASQQQSYAPFTKGGIYGGSPASTPGGKGVVPAANLPVAHLGIANPARAQQGDTLMGDVQGAMNIGDTIKKANDYRKDIIGHPATPAQAAIPADPKTGAAAVAAVPAQNATGLEWLKTLGQPQGQAHGGVVGYADGGSVDPYQTDDPMSQVVSDTEKDKSQHGLMTAQNPTGQSSSTLGDLSKIAAIPGEISGLGTMASAVGSGVGAAASGIGSFLSSLGPFALALKDGGVAEHREHHADGDRVGDAPAGGVVANAAPADSVVADAAPDPADDFVNKYWSKHVQQESGGKQFNADGTPLTSPKGAVGVGQIMPSTGPEAAKLAGVEWSPEKLASDPEYNQTLGKAYLKAQYQKYQDPALASAAYNAGPGNVDLALEKASTKGGSYLNYLPAETQKYVSSIYGGPKPADNGILGTLGNMFGAGPAQAQEPPKDGQKSLGDTLMSEQFLIPLLSGIGTMAGSNSRYLGAAILQGLGGGAKTYEDVQSNIASRGLTGAQTAQQQALTRGTDITNLQKSFQQTPYGNIVWLADGSFIPASDYQRRHDAGENIPLLGKVPGGPGNAAPAAAGQPPQAKPPGSDTITNPLPAAMTAPAPKGEPIGQAPTDFYDKNSAATAIAEGNQKGAGAIAGGPSALIPIERSKVYIDNVDKVGSASRDNQQNVHELASNLADVSAAKGWNAPGTAYTTRAQISGIANTISRAFGGQDILDNDTPAQISEKLTRLQGLMKASGAGQESVRALDELANANANPNQNPKAYAQLTSLLMTQTQRGIDQANHANLYGQDSGNSYVNAPADFERKNPSARYGTEAKAIENVMLNDPALFKQMISGNMDPTRIDKLFETHGFRGMSRYFTGGR